MPTFDFDCVACAHRFDALQRVGSRKPACPRCGSTATRKLPSAPAVRGSSKAAPVVRRGPRGSDGCGHLERPDRRTADGAAEAGA